MKVVQRCLQDGMLDVRVISDMSLTIDRTNRFKKDVKLMLKRGKSIAKLKTIITQLAYQKPLSRKYKYHMLTGNFNHARECHIEPDWLLIYTPLKGIIRLERTGTHADLFG